MDPSKITLKSTTSVTIKPAEEVDGVVGRRDLEREFASCDTQLQLLKGAAHNFGALVDEKDKAITTKKVNLQLLRDSVAPLEKQIEQTHRSAEKKRINELHVLLKKLSTTKTDADDFLKAVASYKEEIEARKRSLGSHRARVEERLEKVRRRWKESSTTAAASLKEAQKVHKQVAVERSKHVNDRKEQIEKVNLLKQTCQRLHDDFTKVGVERSQVSKNIKDLDASVKEVEEEARRLKDSPLLDKISDNKRNATHQDKNLAVLVSDLEHRKKGLDGLAAKGQNLTQELSDLKGDREGLEKTFGQKMTELDKATAENLQKQIDLENTRKKVDEFEQEMLQKIEEARKASESYGQRLADQVNNARRASQFVAEEIQDKKRREEEERERAKDELRDELCAAQNTLDKVRECNALELETKKRYYSRLEKELEKAGLGDKEDLALEVKLAKNKFQEVGVSSNRDQTQFEQKKKELELEIELEKENLAMAKTILDAQKKMKADEERAAKDKAKIQNLERQMQAKKEKLHKMHKEEFELRRSLDHPSPASNQVVQLREGTDLQQDSARRTPSPVVDQGAFGHCAAKSRDCSAPNSDFSVTTTIRKVVYQGRGIDKKVLEEAYRVAGMHRNGVQREEGESEHEHQLRNALVNNAFELQLLAQNLQMLKCKGAQGCHKKEGQLVQAIEESQRKFSDLTRRLSTSDNSPAASNQESVSKILQQMEQNIVEDGKIISSLCTPGRCSGQNNNSGQGHPNL